MTEQKHINDRPPNFYADGKFHLVKCFKCSPNGRENWACNVAEGFCTWCGWHINQTKND